MIRFSTDHRDWLLYYASDDPRRFPLETDAMLRARLRRIMTTPAGLIAVSRADDTGGSLLAVEVMRAMVGSTLWGDPGWQERAACRR